MKRIFPIAVTTILYLSTGCDVVVGPGAAERVDLPETQFFRITRDEESGTWVGGFVAATGSTESGGG